jgi:hypothetical protein
MWTQNGLMRSRQSVFLPKRRGASPSTSVQAQYRIVRHLTQELLGFCTCVLRGVGMLTCCQSFTQSVYDRQTHNHDGGDAASSRRSDFCTARRGKKQRCMSVHSGSAKHLPRPHLLQVTCIADLPIEIRDPPYSLWLKNLRVSDTGIPTGSELAISH